MNVAEFSYIPEKQAKKPVILCVDDEQMVLVSLKSQLKRHFGKDFIIETVDSAEEAIEIFRDYQINDVEVPLVISDQIMPGMKGDEFLKAIHGISENTLKILLTGQASTEAIANSVNHANLYRYISKPWEQTDLSLTVNEAVRCFFQSRQLETQNAMLKNYAETLEERIRERTDEIAKQKAELELKNSDITSSINYAWRIQKATLPEIRQIREHLPESFVFFLPRDIVSGDFYWFSKKGEKIFIAVVDCTGHGVPGGFMSIIGQNLLNDIINKQKIYDPAQVLQKLDESVNQILQQDVTNVNDGMDIALCVYDREENTIEFAGANQPLIYISSSGLTEIKPTKRPIGGSINTFDQKIPFSKQTLTAEPGTTFYIFSDGYADQFGGEKNKKFLKKNLLALLHKLHPQPMLRQSELLEQNFHSWRKGNPQVDDILLIGFRV